MREAVLNRRRQHFEEQRRAMLASLDREQVELRISSLANGGMAERDIAELLRLHIEQVRRALGRTS